MTARITWKQGEERIARRFGTHRTPLSGGNSRHTMSDSLHKSLFIEIKHRQQIPGDNLWTETKKLSKKENKIPMIVFIKKGSPKPILMCNLDDVEKIAEERRKARQEKENKEFEIGELKSGMSSAMIGVSEYYKNKKQFDLFNISNNKINNKSNHKKVKRAKTSSDKIKRSLENEQ